MGRASRKQRYEGFANRNPLGSKGSVCAQSTNAEWFWGTAQGPRWCGNPDMTLDWGLIKANHA